MCAFYFFFCLYVYVYVFSDQPGPEVRSQFRLIVRPSVSPLPSHQPTQLVRARPSVSARERDASKRNQVDNIRLLERSPLQTARTYETRSESNAPHAHGCSDTVHHTMTTISSLSALTMMMTIVKALRDFCGAAEDRETEAKGRAEPRPAVERASTP